MTKKEKAAGSGRPDKIFSPAENENPHRHNGHRRENHPPGNEQAQAVSQVIDGLEQELADVAVLDVGRDLPVVLVHRRQCVNNSDQQVIGYHPGQAVAGHLLAAGFAGINGAPEINRGQQRDEAERGPKEKVESIDQRVGETNFNHVPVFLHGCRSRPPVASGQCSTSRPVAQLRTRLIRPATARSAARPRC